MTSMPNHDHRRDDSDHRPLTRRPTMPNPGALQEGLTDPQRAALALQRTLGNAAASQVIAGWQQADPDLEPDQSPGEVVHDVLRSPGRPLGGAVRGDMEARLGADFSTVRLHTGPAASRSAAELNASAYTVGENVVLGGGSTDHTTLAHELTHVIQQRGGPVSGGDIGGGLRVSDPADPFERAAEDNARRAMSGPVPEHPATTSDSPIGNHVQQIQRYTTDADPVRATGDQTGADTLPRFATNRFDVTLDRDDSGQRRLGIAKYSESKSAVLNWSGDESLAINSRFGAKEFYAVPAVINAANQSLAEAGSPLRLQSSGHSLPNSRGETLSVVRPQLLGGADVLTSFMRLTQHECVDVAERLLGGSPLTHAVFRGPAGDAVTGEMGLRASNLPALADTMISNRPPMTPTNAALDVQGPSPATQPGRGYGEALYRGSRRVAASSQAIGVNEYARARVGEGLTTQTISAPNLANGQADRFDYSRGRVPEERIWVYHYAPVVVESRDGRDQITLENFNRQAWARSVAEDAADKIANTYEGELRRLLTSLYDSGVGGTEQGVQMFAKLLRVRDGELRDRAMVRAREQVTNLERDARNSMGEMWYFKMYEPGGERSFHAQNKDTALNPMTVATTHVQHLTFEPRTDQLTQYAEQQLDRIAAARLTSPTQLLVEGRARGGAVPIRQLAQRRADRVRDELIRRGVLPNRISIRTEPQSDVAFATVTPADRPNVRVGRS
jgi:outer membrane protein OmpA-like peptidoglycan-associated protein